MTESLQEAMSGSLDLDLVYLHPCYGDNLAAYQLYPLIPVGLVAIVNHIREGGITVRGLDVPLELRKDPSFSVGDWLASRQFTAALIDVNWYLHLAGGLDLALLVKQFHPRAKVIIGGLTATRFAGEILSRCPAVDFVIRGDAEIPARLLAETLTGRANQPLAEIPNLSWREGDEVRANPQTYVDHDMGRWNYTDVDFLESERDYYFTAISKWADLATYWLAIGRGCNFACYHCDGSKLSQRLLFGRSGVMTRDPRLVARDIALLAGRGVENVSLTHDLLHLGEEYWRALFRAVRDTGARPGIMQPFWQSLPNEDFARELAATFDMEKSYVNISIETAVEEMRRHIHSCNFYTNAEFFTALGLLKRYGVPIMVYFRLNSPWESARTLEVNIKTAAAIGKMFPSDMPPVFVSDVPLDPSSPYATYGDRYPFAFPRLTFEDYLSFSRGVIAVEKVFVERPQPLAEMREYSEFDQLTRIDVLFIKKLVPRLWERWEELMASDGHSWDTIRGGVVV